MTHRPGRLARLAAAALLAGLALPAMAAPAGAADAITLEARALVGGRFESNGWIALAATLSNSGSPVTGYLATDGEDGTVRRFVELPAGAHKVVTIYVRPAAFVRTIAIRPGEESIRLGQLLKLVDAAEIGRASCRERV